MNRKAFRVFSTASVFALIICFQNCSGTNFTYDDATFASKAMNPEENNHVLPEPPGELPVMPIPEADVPVSPVAGPPATIPDEPENFLDFYSGICKQLKDVTLPLSISANAQDFSIENTTDSIVIEEGRNVEIKNHISQTRIHKAETLKMSNLGGKTIVSANHVFSVQNAFGRLCINAVTIGQVKNVAIDTKIIANEIAEISNIVGRIHIYRATVGVLKNSVGRICLHDGARILKKSNSVFAKVGSCD